MDQRTNVLVIARGRIVMGLAMLLVPSIMLRVMFGRDASTRTARAMARMFGAREVVLGVGTITSAEERTARFDGGPRLPRGGEVVDRGVVADRDAGEQRGAEAGRFAHGRDLDRTLRRVGEGLHERRVVGHAAVDAHTRDRDAAVG